MIPRPPGRFARAAVASLLLVGAAGPLAGATVETPSIHDLIDYREVSGNSQAALISALDRLAQPDPTGQRFYADTHWELRWNFRVDSAPGERCRITSASTDLTVHMTLPRWNAPSSAPRDLVKRWNRFATALRKHEDGHRDIAIEAAREIADRASATPPADGCAALKRTLGDLADSILNEYRGKERRYDATTQHGRTQGAIFR